MQQFELQIEQTYQFPRQVSYNNFQGNEKKALRAIKNIFILIK